MALTEEQKKEYLEKGGTCCPFCGTHDITAGEMHYEVGECWQEVSCDSCAKEWDDLYTLTGVEEREER